MPAYKDQVCYITDYGKRNVMKQTNGYKFAICGYVLLKDINNYLYNKYNTEGSKNTLRQLTLDDLLNNVNVIFNKVTYHYDDDLFRAEPAQYQAAVKNPGNYLFPLNMSYNYDEADILDVDVDGDGEDDYAQDTDTTYVSYDVIVNKELVNVVDVTGDQSFDGVAFIARPYKTERQDDIDIVDPQKLILFAIQYFPGGEQVECPLCKGEGVREDGKTCTNCGGDGLVAKDGNPDKILILKDQHENLVFNIEMHVGFADAEDAQKNTEIQDISILVPSAYNKSIGLHLVNDATANTVMPNQTYGTFNKLYISTLDDDVDSTYDTFAKLNIMTTATSQVADSVPQLMFSLAANNEKRTWNGQRLAFNYASGNQASLFRIYEVKGAGKKRINFELLGSNNLYRDVKGAYGNSFIYSQNNDLPYSGFDNTFINSDNNIVIPHRTNELTFINSNYNVVRSGTSSISGWYPGVNNVTFMNTDNSILVPYYSYYWSKGRKGNKGVKGKKGEVVWSARVVGGHLSNHVLMNSDYNFLVGHNNHDYHGTFISSPSAKHVFTEFSQYDLELGNSLGYTNNNSGNLISIGRGLLYRKGIGDKIILGHFNYNDTNPDNVLIVGDGFLSQEYLSEISGTFEDNEYNDKFYGAFSGRGDQVRWYRHNLLEVNRNGWIKINEYTDPNNYAMYGVSGVTANMKGAHYDIPWSAVYAKLNVYDSMKEFQDIIDSYTEKVETINNIMPTNKSIAFSDASGIDLSTYFGNDISAIKSNSLINITYQTTANRNSSAFATTVRSDHFEKTEKNGYVRRYETRRISAYNSLQYLYLRDTQNHLTGFFAINN